MKNKINRDSEEYSIIEDYEDYEFTYAVAFQMAMRNKTITKLLIEYYSLNPREEFNNDENIEKIEILEKKLLDDYFIGHNILVNLQLYKEFINGKTYGYIQKIPFPRHGYDLSLYSKNYSIAYKVGGHKETKAKKSLFPIFSEPKLTVKPHQDKSIQLSINFSLPKKEILAYIEHLKHTFDKDNLLIQSAYDQEQREETDENLIKDLIDFPNIHCGTVNNYNKKDYMKPKDIIHTPLSFTKSEQGYKYADAFYIYDYIQNNSKFSKDSLYGDIEIDLNTYHTGSPTKKHLGKTQIRKYFKYMIKMIDDLEYKSLLTGNTSTST